MFNRAFMIVVTVTFSLLFLGGSFVKAEEITLYTPYSGLSVTPGENISYDISVINNGSSVDHVTFSLEDLPKKWDYTIRSGGYTIEQLSILPQESEDITLEVDVPLEIKKGSYGFELITKSHQGGSSTLPFTVKVAEEGTFKTDFNIEQPNMQGHADSTLSYAATLINQTAEEQHYSVIGDFPEGWLGELKVDGDNVTSVTIEPGESQNVTIDLTPAENVKADTYEIPITASTGSTKSEIILEADIIGKYDLNLSTPDGNVSSKITAGKKRSVSLTVENIGTAILENISLSSVAPPEWEVTFEDDKIQSLEPGEKQTVQASIEAPREAVAGDYVTNFTAEAPEVSSEANFRVSVKTSTLWGFISVGIIIAVIGSLYFIFKKYGRR